MTQSSPTLKVKVVKTAKKPIKIKKLLIQDKNDDLRLKLNEKLQK